MTFIPKSWGNFVAGGTPITAAALIDLETRVTAYADTLTFVVATPQVTSYTLALGDALSTIDMNSASAVNVTVPPNASVAFTVGTVVEVLQYGAGQVTLVPGAGVTLRTPASLTTRAQYSAVGLRKRATNEWIVSGDLT